MECASIRIAKWEKDGDILELTEFGKMLLVLCGGIITLAEAGKVIYNMAKPGLSLKKRVEKLEEVSDPGIKDRIDSLEHKADADYKAIMKLHDLNAGMCQAIIALMNHEIDGNHIDGLKKRRDDLIEMLTESC